MSKLVKVLNLSSTLGLPEYATPESDGVDLMACFDYEADEKRPEFKGGVVKLYNAYNELSEVLVDPNSPLTLMPLCRALIPTGLKIDLPIGTRFHTSPRSGLALKQGISIPNTPGKVDSDYHGMIYVELINFSLVPVIINHGDRIAQGSIESSEQIEWFPIGDIKEMRETERGASGIGSSGVGIRNNGK